MLDSCFTSVAAIMKRKMNNSEFFDSQFFLEKCFDEIDLLFKLF